MAGGTAVSLSQGQRIETKTAQSKESVFHQSVCGRGTSSPCWFYANAGCWLMTRCFCYEMTPVKPGGCSHSNSVRLNTQFETDNISFLHVGQCMVSGYTYTVSHCSPAQSQV